MRIDCLCGLATSSFRTKGANHVSGYNELVLVTGATGYIGGRLVAQLLEAGYRVRVLTRDPARLQGRTWTNQVEVVQADVLRAETLPQAFAGVGAAFYLVHTMNGVADFRERNKLAARNFGQAARAAGVGRILYLGSLGDAAADHSQRLLSRQETGDALREAAQRRARHRIPRQPHHRLRQHVL